MVGRHHSGCGRKRGGGMGDNNLISLSGRGIDMERDAGYIRAMIRDGIEFEEEERGICAECGEKVLLGQPYAQIGSGIYHKACLDEMDSEEILNLCGFAIRRE